MKRKHFWVIKCFDGTYVMNDHALVPYLDKAQKFTTRQEARDNKKKNNPGSSEKIIKVKA